MPPNSLPPIPYPLLQALKSAYPPRPVKPGDAMEEIFYRAGQQQIIAYMEMIYAAQLEGTPVADQALLGRAAHQRK